MDPAYFAKLPQKTQFDLVTSYNITIFAIQLSVKAHKLVSDIRTYRSRKQEIIALILKSKQNLIAVYATLHCLHIQHPFIQQWMREIDITLQRLPEFN